MAKEKCDLCNGRGYTMVQVGDKKLRSPCPCSNDEARRLQDDMERLNKVLQERNKKNWN